MTRSKSELLLENTLLRQQLIVLKRGGGRDRVLAESHIHGRTASQHEQLLWAIGSKRLIGRRKHFFGQDRASSAPARAGRAELTWTDFYIKL